MDFQGASVNMAGGCSTDDARPRSINAQTSAASFESDLQAAQLVFAPEGLGTSPPDVPLDDLETSDISEDSSLTEPMMWLGVTLPLPIEQRPRDTGAITADDSALRMPSDSKQMTRAELTHWIEVQLAPVGEPREELTADPRFVSIDPDTVDSPVLDPGLRFTPDTMSPETTSSFTAMDERLLANSSMDDVRLPLSDQTLAPPTVEVEPHSFDAPTLDAPNSVTIDRPMGFVVIPPNEVPTNISHAETQSSRGPGGISVEPRTELSEVVRQVRTMVTEHETRSTIQLEPAELGRLTLELVEAPEGLRAYVSAEDPAVLRFLERNVQLLETEARLQGVGHMSFSVGADVSGGLGRGDQRQSEAEASFRQNIEWNTHQPAKPRSRRELDTNA